MGSPGPGTEQFQTAELAGTWLQCNPAEKDLGVPGDSKLNVSQLNALAAMKANRILGFTRARVWPEDQNTWLFHCTQHLLHFLEYYILFFSPTIWKRNW